MCRTLMNIKNFITLQLLLFTLGFITTPGGAIDGGGYTASPEEQFTNKPKKPPTQNLENVVVDGPPTNKQGRVRLTGRTRTTRPTVRRTGPFRDTYEEQCDYISKYCLRNYVTGRLCGRTLFNQYQTFENYCMLDYVNCREKYEVWQVMHMGECYEPKPVTEFIHETYDDDFFLDTDYVEDDLQWDW